MKRSREKISAERQGERGVSRRQFLAGTGIVVGGAALGVLGMLAAGNSDAESGSAIVTTVTKTVTSTGTAVPTTAPTTSVPTQTAIPLKLLKTSPEKGPAGTSVTLTGGGLPPGKTVEIIWDTVDGKYDTPEILKNGVLVIQFFKRVFIPKRVSLGQATIGSDGLVTATFTAPSDYGEIHDIYLAVDGQDVAKGGFRLMRRFSMSPLEGPVGTIITIKAMEIGSKLFESTAAVLYDNKFTGFVSATTTRGTAEFQFRAAGPVGKHYISVHNASHATPFLNVATGAASTAHLLPFEQVFTVTKDNGLPEDRMDWPEARDVASMTGKSHIPTMGDLPTTPGVSASVSPASGPVLSNASVKASGLPPGSVDLVWITNKRGDNAEIREATTEEPTLGSATVGQNGTIDTAVTIPNNLGGWHLLKLVQNGKILTALPFYVEQSLVTPLPMRVKAGEKFVMWFNGGGWNEIDNIAAVTYDNAYVGYVCGYANRGQTPIELVATGGPGTHLIDVYPAIYDGGHGDWPWQMCLPQLTSLKDQPGLALGYKLPIYRLAIEIVE